MPEKLSLPPPEALGLRPLDDAERLFFNPDNEEIKNRLAESQLALDQGRYGEVGGPSYRSLDEVLSYLHGQTPDDLKFIRTKLPERIANAYSLQTEIVAESQAAHKTGKARRWTPFMRFASRAGEVNQADQAKQSLRGRQADIIFHRWADAFVNERIAADANGLLFNIIFDANHMYRDENDIHQLVHYVQQELRQLPGQSL